MRVVVAPVWAARGHRRGLVSGVDHAADSQWLDEARTFAACDLSGTDYVYLWVDGIHLTSTTSPAASSAAIEEVA